MVRGVRAAEIVLAVAVVVGNGLVLKYLGLVPAVVYTVVSVAAILIVARRAGNRE